MKRNFSQIIWVCTISIVAIGLITLYSAASDNARVSHSVFFDQLLFAFIGLGVMAIVSMIDYRKFYDFAYIFYGMNVFLLILVMVAGRHALGAQRWFSIAGFNFQPSELAKLGWILALGRYMSDRRPVLSFDFSSRYYVILKDLLVPFMIAAVPMFLIFKQPDLGTAILFFGIFFIMVFISGLEYRYLAGFVGVCLLILPFGWHILKPYQKDRLLVFLNPNIDPLGAGYTIIQSKIGVGSGQIFGKGWLSGTQNQLNFLPERHTDFIFSVIGEEWGFVGAGILLTCYFLLIYTGLKIAEQVKDKFGVQVTVGIVGILILQVVINLGMVTGICPVVGLTLPMVSYGRSSFMTFMIMLGFLLNLSRRRTVF
ncbi:MAG: rod shape-determining protein RodA [Candidatus Omnitrophica bacterium]|nr:rod shape-determining protein RodA [Candidatus Omnitrophota bacterium]